MNEWTEKHALYIAKRVLADETANEARKELARAVLFCKEQPVIDELFARGRAFSEAAA